MGRSKAVIRLALRPRGTTIITLYHSHIKCHTSVEQLCSKARVLKLTPPRSKIRQILTMVPHLGALLVVYVTYTERVNPVVNWFQSLDSEFMCSRNEML